MSELAKSHIDIIDDSSYGAGTSAIIPLYVFATEQDRVIDEDTGEIAPGTTKAVANEVLMLTSRKDVTDTYGVPQFTTVNGTVQQGDELNEVGLYGLYDALGNSSLAYAIRADIDLKQLKASKLEPKGKPENNKLWFDMDTNTTSYGLFRANGKAGTRGWERIENITVLYDNKDDKKSKSIEAQLAELDSSIGDIVAAYDVNGLKFYEKTSSGEWYVIGSDDWKNESSEGATLTITSHTQVPESGVAGSIWLKTTEPNYGAKFIMKQYSSASDSWIDTTVPTYASFVDAEYAYGPLLAAGSKILNFESDPEDAEAVLKFYEYKSGAAKVSSKNAITSLTEGNELTVRVVGDDEIVEKTVPVPTVNEGELSDKIAAFVKEFNKAKISDLVAETNGDKITITSGKGYSIELSGSARTELNLDEEAFNWILMENLYASDVEPTVDAEEGTLWFNDDLNIDIMVNNNGAWNGYVNKYTDAKVFAQPSAPLYHDEEHNQLCENDIWVNTAAVNYPEIHRYIQDEGWVLVDNTDQTTPDGVIFADVRENAGYEFDNSVESKDLLVSDYVDPYAPNPQSYPDGILLFNTMLSGNNIKEFKDVYAGYSKEHATYTVGNSKEFDAPGTEKNKKTTRWVSASGNAADGSGLFGRKAQRAMIVKALAAAINSNEDIRSKEYDFFYACCPGYPELDDELVALNAEKKEMFYIVSDTPARLKAKANDITAWATNKNNAPSHGENGRIIQSAYMTRQYPSMGLTSNVDGTEIAVPTSIAKMKNLLLLPRGMFAAGTQYGQVKNLASVGYINDEEEYNPVTIREGLGEVIVANKMNPIMPQRNTGLLFWGENTENAITSSLSDEHAILTLLRLKRELDEACLPFFFRANTEALRKDFDATLRSILNDYVGREELYDYVLVTDRSVNTPERIERKELWAEIAIEIVKGVEQIYIPIRIVKTGSLNNS